MNIHKYKVWNGCQMSDYQKTIQEIMLEDGSGFEGIENLTFLQYLGRKDKEGTELFEGDIVTCRMSLDNGSLPHCGEIVYSEEFCAFATKNLAGETLFHNHLLYTLKKIGNKFENPELLEGQTNNHYNKNSEVYLNIVILDGCYYMVFN